MMYPVLTLTCLAIGVVVVEGASTTITKKLDVGEAEVEIRKLKGNTTDRIVGGKDVEPLEFPFAVNLRITTSSGKKFLCGGTVLTPTFILTAVHCIKYDGLNSIIVSAGSADRGTENEQAQHIAVAEAITENYDATVMKNDVAILKLASELKYNDAIQPICLASGNEQYSNQPATVIGWGKTAHDGKTSGMLQKLEVQIPSNQECVEKGATSVTESNICIVVRDRAAGVCFGDSGGPLVTKQGDKFVQIGVASYIIGTCGSQNIPSVYARISSFTPWIEKHVGQPLACK
jgi:secreted trypsin-like serine protease